MFVVFKTRLHKLGFAHFLALLLITPSKKIHFFSNLRFLKREPQKPESLSKVTEVFSDRIRVPWFWGGARKVELSIIPPLILLPVLLHIAALHFMLGIVVLTALPGLVLWYYYFTHRKKGRTLFFLSLALFSLGYMYYLFITEVLPSGDVGPVQVTVVTVGVILTLVALVNTKREPGIVRPNQDSVHSTVTYYSSLPDRDLAPHGGRQDVTMTLANRAGSSEQEGLALKESSQRNWCPVCRVARPPRAGHCRICGVCVLRLDHHCVWWVPLKCLSLGLSSLFPPLSFTSQTLKWSRLSPAFLFLHNLLNESKKNPLFLIYNTP